MGQSNTSSIYDVNDFWLLLWLEVTLNQLRHLRHRDALEMVTGGILSIRNKTLFNYI